MTPGAAANQLNPEGSGFTLRRSVDVAGEPNALEVQISASCRSPTAVGNAELALASDVSPVRGVKFEKNHKWRKPETDNRNAEPGETAVPRVKPRVRLL